MSKDDTVLNSVDDLKYLGSFVVDSSKDFVTRKAQAWSACNRLYHVWQSNISVKTKIAFFKACVESILLYGSETWSMTKRLQENLDGPYTRLLIRVKNITSLKLKFTVTSLLYQRWLRKEEQGVCWTLLQSQRSDNFRRSASETLMS